MTFESLTRVTSPGLFIASCVPVIRKQLAEPQLA
jgi:hypothetical protein